MEFCFVFCVFCVYFMQIFLYCFGMRRDGIQEVSGSIPIISTNHRKAFALRCFLHLKKQYMHTEKR